MTTPSLFPAVNQPIVERSSTVHKKRSRRAAPGEKFDDYIMRRKKEMEIQHKRVSIYRSPLLVLSYFIMYAYYEARSVTKYLYSQRRFSLALMAAAVLLYGIYHIQGPHQYVIHEVQQMVLWYGYWVILGIASAFGLGTGLHTFLLFLGPYIAEVTMAAYECNGANQLVRDSVSYRVYCPSASKHPDTTALAIPLWSIYRKIRWESFAWGAGTALGELPPYFVTRAVALAGGKSNELDVFEAGLHKATKDRSLKEHLSFLVYTAMKHFGFFGILLFASIPNPLFDLAGMMCGHFLVPFTTFFGATFVGKACIKASIQSLVVILAFSRDALTVFLDALQTRAPTLHKFVEQFIYDQTHKIGEKVDDDSPEQTNFFSLAWSVFLSLMLCYFVVSSVESLGLAFMKREHEEELKRLEQERQQLSIPSSN